VAVGTSISGPENPFMPRERNLSPLFILIAIIAVVTTLYVAKQILLPICLAVLLSFLLTPLANWIERWGLPRVPSVISVVLITFAALAMLGWIVTGQLVALQNELPKHRARIADKAQAVTQLRKVFQRVGDDLTNGDVSGAENLNGASNAPDAKQHPVDNEQQIAAKVQEQAIANTTVAGAAAAAVKNNSEADDLPSSGARGGAIPVKVVEMPPSPLTQAQTWLGPLLAPFAAAGMVFVLVFFLLLDRENQRNRIIQLFGTANLHTTTEAITDATRRVGRYLRMQFLINAGYGVAVALGLGIIGVPSAIMWGVLGFSLRFLPYLGPWLAAVFPILVSLAVSDGWTRPLIVVGMYVVYELVLNNVAEPMLYGSSTGVSTVGVIIAAIFWTWLWGPIGLILAMPMTVCLVVTARYVPQLRFITVLLADQPPLSPAERVYQRLLALDYQEPLKLAQTHLKTESLVDFYDAIIIPALVLAEQDRHAGLLHDDEAAAVHEAAEDLVDELAESDVAAHALAASKQETPVNDTPHGERGVAARVLCVPLRDKADEITARMLAELLKAEGFQVDSESADSLTSEVVERVAASDVDLVVISVLPPIRPRESRLLWKRLRHRYPDLPIIVGYWIGSNASESLLRPPGDDASKVATTLAETITLVRSTAAQRRLAKAV
jgi:predicted PurR-regulated permease PerM